MNHPPHLAPALPRVGPPRSDSIQTWGVLASSDGDASVVGRLFGLLSDYLDGVVSVSQGHTAWRTSAGPGVLGRLLTGLSSVPKEVERVAYLDAGVLDTLGIEPVLEMISWLDHEHAAVVRAAPVTDALKVVKGTRIMGSVDRSGLFSPEPPHIFRRETLDAVLQEAGVDHMTVGDPAALLVNAGYAIRVVPDTGPPLTISRP